MGSDNIILPAIMIVNYILGLVPNVFIFSVNFQHWMKRERLSSADQIMVGLAFCGMIYSCVNCAACFISIFPPGMSSVTNIPYILGFFALYTCYSNAWLGTCLCFFFYVKIINFEHRFLSWLKMKIDTLVPWMILVSEVVSIFSSLLYTFTCIGVNIGNSSSTANQAPDFILNPCGTGYKIINFYIPIVISTVITSHIIVSLYKHTHRMSQNMGDGGGTSLEVHKRAACTLTSLVVFYITVYGLVMVSVVYKSFILGGVLNVTTSMLSVVLPIILIRGSTRLKQTCVKIFHILRGENLA
ncbi:hypothetical protein GDO86_017632 [Hymenochirus boettgeri]|uniref:Taste receptor type 2 n=1 Tax=Hymenochirus boettgeri TaxID=247094 RepID=A0A8T2INP7_9PIPI|nr:hypothetical protein GDO86_017632 [Hymenochirus boettgeri]